MRKSWRHLCVTGQICSIFERFWLLLEQSTIRLSNSLRWLYWDLFLIVVTSLLHIFCYWQVINENFPQNFWCCRSSKHNRTVLAIADPQLCDRVRVLPKGRLQQNSPCCDLARNAFSTGLLSSPASNGTRSTSKVYLGLLTNYSTRKLT